MSLLASTPRALSLRAEFYYQLATMVRAGLSIVAALQTLEKNPPSSNYRVPVRKILIELRGGNTLSGALLRVADWLPIFDQSLIEAGEKSGRLDQSFSLLAGYYEERALLIRGFIKQMIFPVLTCHFALFVFPVNLLVAAVLKGEWTAFLLNKVIGFGLFYTAGLALVFITGNEKMGGLSSKIEGLSGLIPWLGLGRRNLALARLASALEALLSAGVGIVEAWELSAKASGSPALLNEVRTWRPQIEHRQRTPSEIMSDKQVFPPLFISLYLTGEISGKLDTTLKRLHDYCRVEGHRQMQLFYRAFSMGLYLLMMSVISIQIIQFWAGYFASISNE